MARKDGEKHSARDVVDMEEVAAVQGIFREFGRALCFTIMCAQYPSGGALEDELIERADEAWSKLADKVIAFAGEDR